MTNLHSTQTKKSYRKPVLVKRGNVAKLTRAQKGSISTDGSGFAEEILP